jgi:hypothetical protein
MPFVQHLWTRVSAALRDLAVPDVQAADGADAPPGRPTVDEGFVAVQLVKDDAYLWVVVPEADERHVITVDGEAWHHVRETDDGAWVYAPTAPPARQKTRHPGDTGSDDV